jgi:hypothetical protein
MKIQLNKKKTKIQESSFIMLFERKKKKKEAQKNVTRFSELWLFTSLP